MKFLHTSPAALAVILSAFLLAACSSDKYLQPAAPVAEVAVAQGAGQYALAMPEQHAADAVAAVLADGGNAVDAAVTAAFALAVTFPEAGNIGGGGFMLTRMNGENLFLDYRETAPAAASRDMYVETDGSVDPRSSLVGVRAAGVPGTVAGMWEAHQKYGTKQWSALLAPAIKLAEQGYTVHSKTQAEYAENRDWFGDEVNFHQHFSTIGQGGLFKQPELAATLRRIAALGPEDFYQGETAQLLVQQMQRDGGLITLQDLQNYKAVWRAPLSAKWRGYEIVSAPPPSSGGFAVIHLLKMKDMLAEHFVGVEHNSPQYVHLIAEMEKRVFADRAEYFGDPDFVSIPMAQIMAEDYIAHRAGLVNPERISPTDAVQAGLESFNTTHFSIVDQWGNAVSNTYTLNWGYGSGVVVEGAGFLLNDEMDDFSTKPGVPNVYGVIGGEANEIQPNKRMLSSMSPTLVTRNGEVEIVVGGMGGSTIFTSVFQVISNLLDFDMSAYEAADAGRFHHQLLPKDLVTTSISRPLSEQTKAQLEDMGYTVQPHAFEFGDVQVIARKNGSLTAASDPRDVGKAIVGTAQVPAGSDAE